MFEAETRLLRENGHEVETYVEANERVVALGRIRTAARTVWSPETHHAIRERLATGKIDIVHVHNFFPLISPSIYYAAREAGVPVVQTLHNYRLLCVNGLFFRDGQVCEDCVGRLPLPGIQHACYRDSRSGSATVAAMLATHRAIGTWNNLVNTYIALSNFSRDKFIEGGLPSDRITVKPNFLATDPGLGEGQGGYALYVGRLSPEKGIGTVLAAWRRSGMTLPLKVVGDGPLRSEVEAAAKVLPAVDYLGRLSNEDVLRQMQEAMFLIVPSECYENFPMTIVEAFSVGLPVLASNLGSTGSLVENGVTGRHFVVGDADDLAQQAGWLSANQAQLSGMRVAARAAYENHYTSSINYRKLRTIYETALAGSDHGA